MREKIIQTLTSLRKAIINYPLFLTSALVLMLAVECLIATTSTLDSFLIQKMAFTAGIGISLSFGVAMLAQRFQRALLWNILTLIFLSLFYFLILPTKEGDFTEKYIYILIPCYILSHLFVSIAPFFQRKQQELSFWHYNKTLFINFFLTVVFTGVLCGGVQLALLAMSHLFGLNWDVDLYIKVFFRILILGSAFIFTLFHGDGLIKMEAESPYPVVIAFFTQFILIPLLILYVTILYFYGIKIILLWELPRGWVSYLVLAYAVLGIFALLLVHPLLHGQSKSWVNIFRKLFYYTIFPLLILLFVAIGKRISDYGFTEARYFVLILALWLLFISFYFVVGTNTKLKTIPLSLFMVGLVAMILPYGNVYSLSVWSQKQSFKKILIENGLLDGSKIVTNKPVLSSVVESLQDKYFYLEQRQQKVYVLNMLEEDTRKQLTDQRYRFRDIFDTVQLDYEEKNSVYFDIKNIQKVTELEGYSYMTSIDYQDSTSFTIGTDTLIVLKNLYGENPTFILSVNDKKVDMLPMIEKLVQPYLSGYKNTEVDSLSVQFDHADYGCKVSFDNISVNYVYDNPRLYFSKVLFLFRKNKSL